MPNSTTEPALLAPSRRRFLNGTGKSVLSATAVALLIGCESMASRGGATATDTSNDVAILNVALALEWEAIAAYQIGAESGLLQREVLNVAVQFQGHHKEHANALVGTVRKLGGTPVDPRKTSEYATALNVSTLKSDTDVLKLAARLELGAANAYLGVIPSFGNSDLAQVSGRFAADETMHWTVLANAIGDPLPKTALTFGA